jgi:chemotaxis methyl-accepting protein methylase
MKSKGSHTKEIRAGCTASSSGKEPYIISMEVLKSVDSNNLDFKLLTTDISTAMFQKAKMGIYSQEPTHKIPIEALRISIN